MVRGLTEAVVLFLLPFLLYGVALLVMAGLPNRGPGWTRARVAQLGLIGLALVVAGLVAFGLVVPRREGAYVPAHLDGGRLVPGTIQ